MVQVTEDRVVVRELRDEAIGLCRDRGCPWDETGKDYRDRDLARLAVACDDFGLAREIALVEWRSWASVRIGEGRCDSRAIQSQIELARQIDDPAIYDMTIKGIAKAVTGPRLTRQVYDLALKVEDKELREKMLVPIVVHLRDPELLRGQITDPEHRVWTLSELATRLDRVDLAWEALEIALRGGRQELLSPLASAASRLGDEALLRRLARLVPGIENIELAIVVCDSLGGCDFGNAFSRRAYRMVQSLPEHDPGEDDDMEYDGSREIPLAFLALRHESVTLVRRLRSQYARDYAFAHIAPKRVDLALAREIKDRTFYFGAVSSIASQTGDFDLIDRTLAECREREADDFELFDVVATKLEMIRNSGSPTLPLVF